MGAVSAIRKKRRAVKAKINTQPFNDDDINRAIGVYWKEEQQNEDDFEQAETPQARLALQYRTKARKLALSILRKWHARIDLNELYSIVDLSLCEAGRLYDPKKGASFITFLYYHLRGNLIRAVSDAVAANAVPSLYYETTENAFDSHAETAGRALLKGANANDIAAALCSQDTYLPDEVLYRKEMHGIANEVTARLDELEREVITRMYLNGEQLVDIASDMGYSRCHISRVKKKALDDLLTELSNVLGEEALVRMPEERIESTTTRTSKQGSASRRKVHRRRPRSKKAVEIKKQRKGERKAG